MCNFISIDSIHPIFIAIGIVSIYYFGRWSERDFQKTLNKLR